MSDFKQYLEELRFRLLAVADISREKDINYGHQFVIEQNGAKVVFTVYDGKKGRKMVWSEQGSPLQCKLEEAVTGKASAGMLDTKSYKIWAGSDESGKGDFFGPLVVAAVIVDEVVAHKLQIAGVKDCKALTDKKILELEQPIMDVALNYCVLELKEPAYNVRYEQIKNAGGNLNKLLGNGHIAVLSKVIEANNSCEGALIDQFTPSNDVIVALKNKFPAVDFKQQPRAESDIAVAAASILARARFLRTMAELSQKAGFELHKGGGAGATACAQKLAAIIGKEKLKDYVKMHFANFQKL